MARIALLLHDQVPTDAARHVINRRLAEEILLYRINGKKIAQPISKRCIHVTYKISFPELKKLFVRSTTVIRAIPKLLPPAAVEPNLNLAYPTPDFRSDALQRRRELWMRAYPPPESAKRSKLVPAEVVIQRILMSPKLWGRT